MFRIRILFVAVLVLGAVAYALGHFMNANGIRTVDDSRVVAQEKAENRDRLKEPPPDR